MNIADMLSAQAQRQPHHTAIIDPKSLRRSFSFLDVERQAERMAALLLRHGIKKGDAVLVVHQISAELFISMIALFKIGATAVFLDPSAKRTFIESCFDMLTPAAIITSPIGTLLALASPALRKVSKRFTTGIGLPGFISLAASAQPWVGNAELADEAAALITFTSGSTGKAKAIVRSHRFLSDQLAVIKTSFEFRPAEVDATNLPIFILANLASGITSVIPNAQLHKPGSIEAAPVVVQIVKHNVTRMTASPAFLERICRYCKKEGIKLEGLSKVFTGGGPVFPKLMEDLRRVAPNASLHTVYGSTEAEPIAQIEQSALRQEDRQRMRNGGGLLVGKPEESVRLRILSPRLQSALSSGNNDVTTAMPFLDGDQLKSIEQAVGEPGEIVVSGDHVIKGYLNDRGTAETKFTDGTTIWHRTGDAGYLDREGRLWLVGRCTAEISDRFGSIYPFQVESAVIDRPEVKHAACVSFKGRRTVVVELESKSFAVNSLRQDLGWAHIDDFHIIEKMPVDDRHNSKILYSSVLRELADVRHGALGH